MGPWVIRQFAIVLSEKAQKIPLCDVLCACDFIRWQAIDIRDHPYFFHFVRAWSPNEQTNQHAFLCGVSRHRELKIRTNF